AFGPATMADIRTWSGLTGLREVIERLRPQLRTFRDEQDGELFDPPGAPLPDPDTPAPPRFLPEYDNLVLSHADRSRMFNGLGPGGPFPQGRAIGALLVDGFYRANRKSTEEDGAATLTIDRFVPQPADEAGAVDEIVAEGTGLLEFLAPGASERRVEFFPRV
ncbi:MAG TPA: crosslink repair DNA glycosylase YcaQ family protein, partial [Thermoleophilaceae bacterium]